MVKYPFNAAQAAPDIKKFLVFTLRHGQSLGQIDQKAYQQLGDSNIPLTQTGILQAQAGGRILKEIAARLDIKDMTILTSTGRRSTHTAWQILNVMKDQVRVALREDKRLDKQKFGRFDGFFTSEERKAHCPDGFADFQRQLQEKGAFHARPPEGESIADVQERIEDLMQELKNNPFPTILITHGTNAICAENALLSHGDQWVLNHIDKRGNCSIHALHGDMYSGYRADSICDDPLSCTPDYTWLKAHPYIPFAPA